MFNLNLFHNKSLALDLGNNNTLISDQHSLLVAQPSYIVFDTARHAVKAVGEEAYDMFEKTHGDLKPVKPLKCGVIADYDSAAALIHELIQKAYTGRSFYEGFDYIISGLPYYTSDVERRALMNALEQFNARRTCLVYEPLAAALGMGLNIQEPNGKMVVDIGGGITEIVIISLSGVVSFQSLKVAGDAMDTDIQDYFKKKYGMAIGLKTAEQIKIRAGAAMQDIMDAPPPMIVKGKDMMRGIPVTRSIGHQEVSAILERSITAIENAIVATLEKCSPELASDIYENGIYMTGGNALLRGLGERLEKRTKLPVIIDPQALLSVSKGIAMTLREPKKFQHILAS